MKSKIIPCRESSQIKLNLKLLWTIVMLLLFKVYTSRIKLYKMTSFGHGILSENSQTCKATGTWNMINSLSKERKKKMHFGKKSRSATRSKSSWVCRENGPRSIKSNKRSMSWRAVFSRLALGQLNMSSVLGTMKTLFRGWLTCMVKRKRKLSV